MTSGAGPAVEVRGLTKRYGAVTGVQDLDLDVGPGEVVGFIGPNGAGKSTTMKVLVDLLRPTSGRVAVLGGAPGDTDVRRRVGYLPGEMGLDGRLRAADVLDLLGRLQGRDVAERRDELARRLDLDTSRRLRDLSTGNRQKVGIVAALAHRPELLVLDEPTRGLDPLVQQDFLSLLREARDAGAAVLLSSHVLSEVEEVADRVIMIRAGRLVASTPVRDLAQVVRLEVTFLDDVAPTLLHGLPGVRDVSLADGVLRCTLEEPADAVVKALARHRVDRVRASRPDLEDLFLAQYAEQGL